MNMYSVAKYLERSLGRHCIQDAVDGFVAADAQNGGAQDLVAAVIHHHFHETLRFAAHAIERGCDVLLARLEAYALRLRADRDPLHFEDLLDSGGDVRILSPDETGPLFDNGDFAAESPVHLGEFETDVAAAHHEQ